MRGARRWSASSFGISGRERPGRHVGKLCKSSVLPDREYLVETSFKINSDADNTPGEPMRMFAGLSDKRSFCDRVVAALVNVSPSRDASLVFIDVASKKHHFQESEISMHAFQYLNIKCALQELGRRLDAVEE